jgi:hypothetical protein
MVSGNGNECLTIAPYSPYSAIIVLRPQHFSVFRHLALRFWNQTCATKNIVNIVARYFAPYFNQGRA